MNYRVNAVFEVEAESKEDALAKTAVLCEAALDASEQVSFTEIGPITEIEQRATLRRIK